MQVKDFFMISGFLFLFAGLFIPTKKAYLKMLGGEIPWNKIPLSQRVGFVRIYAFAVLLVSVVLTAIFY